MYKQTMWRVYWRKRKDEDYTNYKEALDAAMTEIRIIEAMGNNLHVKQKLQQYFSYVRSKQNVRDKVGPLEDGYFISMFTRY